MSNISTAAKNAWRNRSAGPVSWGEKLRTGSADKYFIVSGDSHINEPIDVFTKRVNKKYIDRVPHVKIEADGTQWLISDGWAPQPVKIPTGRTDLLPTAEEFESYEVMQHYSDKMEDEDVMRASSGRSLEQRLEHCAAEGVDAELIFPQKGLLAFASPEPEFAAEMCHAWNVWAREYLAPAWDKAVPMALIAPGNLEAGLKEVAWAAANGFKGLCLPNRPVFNRRNQPRALLEYNDKEFEPLWAAIAETGLPITFHVSTGEDPRAVGGKGGAIINFVNHAVTTTMEPLVQMIASGVFERHRSLKAGAHESGIGWIPWMLYQMDHGYRAHHMWIRPVIPDLPSEYFKAHCHATFMEEPEMLDLLVGQGLEDNLIWASDYPHHEGTFPHTLVTIERSMASLNETQRRKVLGENAARIFKLK